ncbi:hypothetical protein OSTOST_12529, partial [Ostertagia ostertagi]
MYSETDIGAKINFSAIAAAITVFVLYDNMRSLGEEKVTRGYFLSEPQLGHQKILVPIELRQVRDMSDDETENASIGVQTSGTRTQQSLHDRSNKIKDTSENAPVAVYETVEATERLLNL